MIFHDACVSWIPVTCNGVSSGRWRAQDGCFWRRGLIHQAFNILLPICRNSDDLYICSSNVTQAFTSHRYPALFSRNSYPGPSITWILTLVTTTTFLSKALIIQAATVLNWSLEKISTFSPRIHQLRQGRFLKVVASSCYNQNFCSLKLCTTQVKNILFSHII